MTNHDKHLLFSPYGVTWLVREDVESITNDGVWRITVTFKDGNTKIIKHDSTADMLESFWEAEEWINE